MSWGWYSDANTTRVFLDILLNANYKDSEFLGHHIKPGECVFGRAACAARLQMSEMAVRTALEHLKQTGEITIRTTNKFSIISIRNWYTYQGLEEDEQPARNQQFEGFDGGTASKNTKTQPASQPAKTTELNSNSNALETPESEHQPAQQPASNHIQQCNNVTKKQYNNTPPKILKVKFNPEGKKKYLDWVYLSPEQFERVRKNYEESGLDRNDFDEAVRELDTWFENNQNMRPKRCDDAKALMGWPKEKAMKLKQSRLALERQETLATLQPNYSRRN